MGEAGKIGQMQAFKNKWIAMKGTTHVVQIVPSVEDVARNTLIDIKRTGMVADAEVAKAFKKRKLIDTQKHTCFSVTKGPCFSMNMARLETDLTPEMLIGDAWRSLAFKPYNFEAKGPVLPGGHLHPLLKVRAEFRQIFFEMGFEEMPTNAFVESSFWNFDALFQPQQHPSRDAHDTFFLKEPAQCLSVPQDYLERVKRVHEEGGYGSIGHRCAWDPQEARKNILRTHTTAVSARMLYALAQEMKQTGVFRPAKYFSIDRVFRNETVDATHLAEFHQIEGLVASYKLTLGDLIGMLEAFFAKLGINRLRFKPAFNPYTEPSMEVFAFHEGLKRWVEVGNSGVFRPEMLEPMGLPSDVRVIAWGLSLERPTMIKYGIGNIRDLLGHRVDLGMVEVNPICRLDK